MSSKQREDLVVPYKHVASKPRRDASNIIAQSLPMAAMFMKNKVLAWAALFLAVQSYLQEPINKPQTDDKGQAEQPALLRILFAVAAVGTCYMDLFFPSTNPALRKAASVATETMTTIAAAATS
ncbi:uncharacterized protein LODBEIA_P42750 [Lodderomyces beijingensis]|uniref:Uncharacterized protein n=1 Tax=Lodderomyces beijingensis TaxID=1775926 RepID=A0ABP0ZSW1_9ASCO